MEDLEAKAREVLMQWSREQGGAVVSRYEGDRWDGLVTVIAQALRDEREACAKVADTEREAWEKIYAPDGEEAAFMIAAAIRQGRT